MRRILGRSITLLRSSRWLANRKREERILPPEGLKVPHRQPKRERLREAEVLMAAWRDHWNPT